MTLPLDDVTFTKYEFVELIKKVAELIAEKNKLLEMLKNPLIETLKSARSCIETPDDLNSDEIGHVLEDIEHAISVIEIAYGRF